MDRKHNGFVAVVSKWISDCKSDRPKLLKSVVSLVLASVILVTCTLCWYCLKTAEITADNFMLEAGKGLRVNDTGTSQFNYNENEYKLTPASSVDGRNLFFPTDGTDFSNVTKDMTFRSANAGDKNVNFIQIDFDVTAQTNLTSIYIDPDKTSLEVYDKANDPNANNASAQQAAPLRMAIWASAPENGTGHAMTPVVFNSQAKTVNTAAVSEVDRGSGAYISNGPQVAHQFSDYAIGGTPITTLSAGKKTYFSIIIWLEGCDPKCTVDYMDKIAKYDIKLKLAFKTSWDNTDVVRFKDETNNEWIRSCIADDYTLTVRYENNETHEKVDFNTYKYRNTTDEWTASVPSDMKNMVYFILSPPAGSTNGKTYTFCKSDGEDVGLSAGDDNTNRGVNRQYVTTYSKSNADSNPTTCQGHWTAIGDSDGGGVDIGDLDGDDF
ncbi:MAG: hypothetical protein IJ932_02600 [Ruminococcus sp.]|nr:hypothetical protein [Ruminococcus sp.]